MNCLKLTAFAPLAAVPAIAFSPCGPAHQGAAAIDLEPLLERLQWLDRRERLPIDQLLAQQRAIGGLRRWLCKLQRLRTRMQWGRLADGNDGPADFDRRYFDLR